MKKMLQKIFSVKNKKNHKIIRILGIKLKFRISEKNMISSQKPVKLYDIKGQNNQIIIVENGNENIFDNIEVIDGLKIVINGSNNTIKLHKPFNLFNNVFIEIGNDNVEIEIEENYILERLHIRACFGTSQKCFIGKNTIHYGGAIVLDENTHCIIEPDCLIAEGLFVWASDGHTIYDNTTKKLLNKITSPVTIGKHTWIGFHVSIMKNSQIAPNSVIGTKSVVTGKFTEENTILAGSPAKIVKRNINWSGISPLMYENEHHIHEIEKNEELPKDLSYTWGILEHLGGDFKQYLLEHDMPQKLKKLYRNLDKTSISVVDNTIKRILNLPNHKNRKLFRVKIKELENEFDISGDDEKRKTYFSEIPYYKKKYLIPADKREQNDYDVEVYLYHHGLKNAGQKIKDYIKNKDFIDAGAYIGDSMLIMQEYLPRKTYSFELSPGNAEKFTETRRLNNLPEDKCILIKKAISEKKGTALINDSAFQGTTLLEKGNIEIETTDIDSFVKENNLNIGFIKADVEGQIIPLIKGAKNTIQKHRPVLCLAIYHSPQEFFEAKPLLEEIVENADYKLEIQSQCPFCDGISSIVIFAYPKELDN